MSIYVCVTPAIYLYVTWQKRSVDIVAVCDKWSGWQYAWKGYPDKRAYLSISSRGWANKVCRGETTRRIFFPWGNLSCMHTRAGLLQKVMHWAKNCTNVFRPPRTRMCCQHLDSLLFWILSGGLLTVSKQTHIWIWTTGMNGTWFMSLFFLEETHVSDGNNTNCCGSAMPVHVAE